jgi:hypothetical protein
MDLNIGDSAVELIQLSLAPVFLIVGIGQMVNVVTGRLARIIDRARYYEDQYEGLPQRISTRARIEITSLRRRMRLANWSITFLTASAVLVCVDVILLLTNGLVSTSLDTVILTMFILALAFLTFFEVSVATATLKIGPYENKKQQ